MYVIDLSLLPRPENDETFMLSNTSLDTGESV